LAQNLLDQGERVAIIDRDASNDKARHLQERGAIVLVGDGTRREQLESAKIKRAHFLFAVTPDDWTNLEIALCAHGLMASASRNCFVHLVDSELRRWLFSWNNGRAAIKSFNIYENAARRLFLEHSTPEITARDLKQETVHLLIIGFGQMGAERGPANCQDRSL
jgi:Trk K+ transport system NAD-binding subunit